MRPLVRLGPLVFRVPLLLCGALYLLLWFDAADRLWERALLVPDADSFATVMLEGAAAIYQAQERILGLPEGTFNLPVTPQFIEMTRQLFESIDRTQS